MMLSKMGFRQLISAGIGSGSAPADSFRRGIRLTAGREFLRDPTKRVLAAHEVAAPAAAPDLPHFVDMRQGDKAQQTFSVAEMERRLSMLRGYMAGQGIGACVFTSFHNIKYFSDFLFCAFGRPYGLVVTMDDAISISAAIDGGQPWRRTYGNNLTYTDWQRDNFYRAIQALVEETPGKCVGFEFDTMPVEQLQKIGNFLPNITKTDVSRATTRLRMFKSPEEIEVIRDGAATADIGGFAIVEALEEGKTEWEIARASTHAMVKHITSKYPEAEIMDTWTWFQSGINTDGAHNPLTTRKIASGDILSLNCFPMISGYYTALERTLFLNHCSDAHLKYWEANVAVHRRGLELIKPGARCCDIAAELNDLYRSMGLLKYRSFGYGHSFGVLSHYYGREAELELREDIETVLQPGMVVSMEPMIMIPDHLEGGGGYREHDILVVTEDASENITKFPFGPEHNIIVK